MVFDINPPTFKCDICREPRIEAYLGVLKKSGEKDGGRVEISMSYCIDKDDCTKKAVKAVADYFR